MSRNGSGTYSLPAGNPVVTNTTISSTWANSTLTDIGSALTGSVASDGQTPMTGPLNLNNNKITSLGTPTLGTDAVTKDYADALTSSLNTANFHIFESGGKLIFQYQSTTIASLDSTGVFTTLSSVVGAGTP